MEKIYPRRSWPQQTAIIGVPGPRPAAVPQRTITAA